MNDKEFGSLELFKLKQRNGGWGGGGDVIIQPFCRKGYPQEIRSPSLILGNLKVPRKVLLNHAEMHWNLVNDEEFGSLKLSKLKYRRGDVIIQPFCRIGCPEEIRSPLPPLIFGNLKTLRKLLLNHVVCFKM